MVSVFLKEAVHLLMATQSSDGPKDIGDDSGGRSHVLTGCIHLS